MENLLTGQTDHPPRHRIAHQRRVQEEAATGISRDQTQSTGSSFSAIINFRGVIQK